MNKEQKELLDSILRYVVPTIENHHRMKQSMQKNSQSNTLSEDKNHSIVKNDKKNEQKNIAQNNEQSQLEKLLNQTQSKSDIFDDIVNTILENNPDLRITSIEEEIEIHERKTSIFERIYGASFERKREGKESYSVIVEYEKTEIYEALKVTIKTEAKSKDPKQKNQYQFELKKELEEPSTEYRFKAVYESNYEKERLSIGYWENIDAYQNIRKNALHDFTDRVPGKWMDVLPESIMGGIMGFTYLGQSYMALREDIRDDTSGEKLMVDVHESIHTPDEYETRILTSWIMERKAMDRYVR